MNNAKIAQKHRNSFEHLVINACLNRCIASKTGLKYNPNNPNEKAEMRIQEKMFFKN